MGSSIIKHAFLTARSQPGGVNLGLSKDKFDIWWQGYSGLGLADLKKKLDTLSQVNEPPNILLLHCGGNDIGRYNVLKIRQMLTEISCFLSQRFPNTRIVWSQILPRQTWRFSTNNAAMHRARQRINGHAANLFIKMQGTYVKHPALQTMVPVLYCADGVHLTLEGNKMFLKQIANAVKTLANSYVTAIC